MGTQLRVLLIEDSEDDAQLLLREIRRGGYEVEFERVESVGAMRTALTQKNWDLIISDYTLPEFNALKGLEVLKATGRDVPFIIISGTIGEDMAISALKAGANDFLIKGKFARLIPAIERELREVETRRQHKRAEEAAVESEARYQRVLDAMMEGCQIISFDWRYIYVNDVVVAQGKKTRAELIDHTMMEVYPGIENTELFKNLQQCMEERTPIRMENQFMFPDGSTGWFELSIQPAREGIFILSTDITDRRRAEERNRFDANLLASVSDAVIAVDMQFKIQSWNAGAAAMYGWDAEEVMGQPARDLLQTEFLETTREAVTQELLEKGFWKGEVVQLHRDGTKLPALSSLSLYKDSQGKPAGIVAVNRDITERKQSDEILRKKTEELKIMSQQLWQAAKLATMGELAASIAHELNNPLATISLRAEMLSEQFSDDDPKSRSLEIIDAEVRRMSNLVANLLQFSRRSGSQVSTIKVNEELTSTLELVQYHLRKNNILAVQELSTDLPLIQADRQQLRQVFLNLFTNAADAMPLGGILTIRTWSGERPEPGITAPSERSVTKTLGLPVSKSPQILIEVSDTGEGIALDRMEQVWEPFFTTKPEGKGTGLGLAICRRIILEHGGTIELLSEGIPGKGTTVQLSLPALNERY